MIRGAFRFLGAVLYAGALVGLAGCPGDPKPKDPGPRATNADESRKIWEPAVLKSDVGEEADVFYVTDSVAIQDTEGNAEKDLREKALKKAVEQTIRDILRDNDLYTENENEINRLFLNQAQKYVATAQVERREIFGDGRQLGVKLRVKVARDNLQKGLQEEGILKTVPMRVILIFRKNTASGAESAELAQDYLDDLGEELSRELIDRGFRTQLWKDVRIRIAERRDEGDKDLERMLTKYVEESDWRKPEDDRYDLPLLLLRSEGRLLVGFRIDELVKRDLAYHATMRVDSYDLLQSQSLGYEADSMREPIGDRTLLATRQAIVTKLSKSLIRKHIGKLVEHLERERRRNKDRKDYKLAFEGYNEPEMARIETLLAGVVAEDVDLSNDGAKVVATAKIARDPIPLRDEIVRSLKLSGLKCKTPRRDGNNFTFVKE